MRRRHSRPSAGPHQNRIEAEPDHRDDHQVHRNDIVESSRREQDDRPHRDSDSSRAIFTRIMSAARLLPLLGWACFIAGNGAGLGAGGFELWRIARMRMTRGDMAKRRGQRVAQQRGNRSTILTGKIRLQP